MYSPAAIVVLEKRVVPEDEQPENEPLFLPLALSEAERADSGCMRGLFDMELLMRDAQCRASLEKLRHQLIIKMRFLNYKSLHARAQGPTTQSRRIVDQNELKIRVHSEKYQAAWSVLFAAAGHDKVLEVKRQRAKERRWKKLQELLDHGVEVPAWAAEEEDNEDEGEEADDPRGKRGESRREISWIWKLAGSTGTDAVFEDAQGIEWSKAYTRSRRWTEEVQLLREEFRHLPISFNFEADQWADRAQRVPALAGLLDAETMEGRIAYALKQEALFRNLATGAKEAETAVKGGMEGSDEEEGNNGGVGAEDSDAGEEMGIVESDKELLMGGEVDDV
ncbi:hypothetical protein K438DRAFT_2004834 [Mycena galopus ATCC 62051]|nr:hypothetical protein K438DRAFT_2004834 [Mycena galopus ATCC 62051]